MNLTEEQAIEKAKKVLVEIDFWSTSVVLSSAKLVQGEDLNLFSYKEEPFWLISFTYGAEDFGEGVAKIFIEINKLTGEVDKNISHRNGSIKINYDSKKDKYVRVKK